MRAWELGTRALLDPDWLLLRELGERYLIHRTATQRPRQPRVMHDLPGPRIEAMMRVSKSRSDKMQPYSRVVIGHNSGNQASCSCWLSHSLHQIRRLSTYHPCTARARRYRRSLVSNGVCSNRNSSTGLSSTPLVNALQCARHVDQETVSDSRTRPDGASKIRTASLGRCGSRKSHVRCATP